MLVVGSIYQTHIGWECLLQTRRKLVSVWVGVSGVGVEVERDVRGIAAFLRAKVDCDYAFVVSVEL